MSDQPNNHWDEWGKLVEAAAQDEPHCAPERNSGDWGPTEVSSSAWEFLPETESKCMAINITGEIWVARGPLETHADGNNNA